MKFPIKEIPDVSMVVDDTSVKLSPHDLVTHLSKSICFVEGSLKPYSINDKNGVAFGLDSIVIVGKSTDSEIASPCKRALESLLDGRKKLKNDC